MRFAKKWQLIGWQIQKHDRYGNFEKMNKLALAEQLRNGVDGNQGKAGYPCPVAQRVAISWFIGSACLTEPPVRVYCK